MIITFYLLLQFDSSSSSPNVNTSLMSCRVSETCTQTDIHNEKFTQTNVSSIISSTIDSMRPTDESCSSEMEVIVEVLLETPVETLQDKETSMVEQNKDNKSNKENKKEEGEQITAMQKEPGKALDDPLVNKKKEMAEVLQKPLTTEPQDIDTTIVVEEKVKEEEEEEKEEEEEEEEEGLAIVQKEEVTRGEKIGVSHKELSWVLPVVDMKTMAGVQQQKEKNRREHMEETETLQKFEIHARASSNDALAMKERTEKNMQRELEEEEKEEEKKIRFLQKVNVQTEPQTGNEI